MGWGPPPVVFDMTFDGGVLRGNEFEALVLGGAFCISDEVLSTNEVILELTEEVLAGKETLVNGKGFEDGDISEEVEFECKNLASSWPRSSPLAFNAV